MKYIFINWQKNATMYLKWSESMTIFVTSERSSNRPVMNEQWKDLVDASALMMLFDGTNVRTLYKTEG